MSWYEAGTVTSVAGTNVITGVGTLWNNPIFGIASGQMIFIPGSGQVVIYEILAVDSDNKIRVTKNLASAITNSEYAIVTTVSNSMSDLARRTAVQLALYQKLLEDWQDITTGTGNVSIIAPDGSTVVIPSLSDLTAWVNDSKTWFDDNRELIENAGEAVAGAETARDEAVAAKTAAQSAEAAAEGSAISASGSATTASDAAAAATDSASIASEAATIATQSKDGAVTARDEAEQFAESVNPDLLMHTTGGTFTGPVILAGDATDPKGAVTKQQLDAKPAGGLPILHSYQTDTRDHIEAGEAPQDGQLLSRALFPDAWAAIQAKRTVITDAAWLGDPLKRGQFSSGDGSTTFRVPDKNGKYSGSLGATVGRGDGVKSAGTVGLLQMDAARNITGSFEFSPSTGLVLDISTLGGAFVKGTTNKAAGTNAQTIGAKDLLFDASKSPGFLVADENRVLSVTTCWVIKLAGAAFNEGQINALELATQITLLSTRIATLESHQKFTYLYPGGSAVAPATLGLSQRIVLDNPFIGRKIDYRCEVQFGGIWGVAGFGSNVGSGSVSVGALAIPWGDNIVVWSGNTWVAHVAAMTANSFPSASTITSAPYRVAVWTIDGLGT
ncbi:phage tail protein [Yersinia enterocolitica]|uniref:phage tail protein n=1 Tax=Yersinia enterocolitica TaxID=630 RepID=UPI0028BAF946|nr:phage tail protein [Yersinia enterocolitica]EKN5944386.1 phage tail protein [Yersinia enterocolitica]EKN6086572.1 phage tail protein [Yersinia enterocolitica]ELI8237602.1 phage tail protein [Yersinia enterocolitica]ELW7379020.1 phage tail protein [Yersinia enterocolitica]